MTSKRYAAQLLDEIVRKEAIVSQQKAMMVFDLAVVFSSYPDIELVPSHASVSYQGNEVLWVFDPRDVRDGDVVVIAYEPKGRPIVLARADGLNSDPTLHPKGAALEEAIDTLFDEARSWRKPVATADVLPLTGNFVGDIRLTFDTNTLHRWEDANDEWVPITSALEGTEDALPITGGTMGGDIVMPSETMITIEDLPVDGTDAVNKDYADSLVTFGGALIVPVNTVFANYTALSTDRVILADATAGNMLISLPGSPATGKIYEVKDKLGLVPGTSIQIDSLTSELFDGLAGPINVTTPFQSITVVYDGSGWSII